MKLALAIAFFFAGWHVPGYPVVRAQPVVFHNAGATLYGTFYYPSGAQRIPAVVALHDASVASGNAALYAHLREGLPAMGIAVLLFDRRGTGHSTGSRHVSYETLASDGVAGARTIAKLPQVDPARIGYWGLSQGGWLVLLAAKADRNAKFVVSVSAPLVTPEEQMEFADTNHLRLLGYSDADVNAMLAARKAWTGYLRGTTSKAKAVAALAAIDDKPWFPQMYMPIAAELTSPSSLSWRKQMDDDLIAATHQVHVPMLFIYGGADPWIPVASTVVELRVLQRTHPNIEYEVVAGAAHEMLFRPHEVMALTPESIRHDVPVAPAYFMRLASWLTRHAW